MGPIKLTAREKVPRLSDTYYLAKWGKIEDTRYSKGILKGPKGNCDIQAAKRE